MKSITIHKLDPDLADSLERKAQSDGTSLNKTIKALLRGALGLSKQAPINRHADFEDLFGSWNNKEANDFDKRIQQSRTIDPSEWER